MKWWGSKYSQSMLLLECRQSLEDRRAACSSSSRWYALTIGIESTSADPSLSYHPYYLSYPSLAICRLCYICHHSLQTAELLERAQCLSWLQLPLRRAWWLSHRAWRLSWRFCPSWTPGRWCALAHPPWRLSLHSHRCRQCQYHYSMALRRDCNSWLSDRSAIRNCQHLRSSVAWCCKGLL